MFDKKGVILIEKTPALNEDDVMLHAIDAGAEDFIAQDDVYEIYTDVSSFSAVRTALENKGYEFASAEITMIPQNTVSISDPEDIRKINAMLECFDDHDDVQNVHHNADLPEEEWE